MTRPLAADRPGETIRTLEALRGGLFTYSDMPKKRHLQAIVDQIRRADRDLKRLLEHADQEIKEVRADLAANTRHYGTSE